VNSEKTLLLAGVWWFLVSLRSFFIGDFPGPVILWFIAITRLSGRGFFFCLGCISRIFSGLFQKGQEFTDTALRLECMPQPLPGVDAVTVSPPVFGYGDKSFGLKVMNDFLDSPFGNADVNGNITQPCFIIPCQADQDVPIVAEYCPVRHVILTSFRAVTSRVCDRIAKISYE
jgi:hypothetical protein